MNELQCFAQDLLSFLEVYRKRVDFPVAPWIEVFLVVTGPIGSVRTE